MKKITYILIVLQICCLALSSFADIKPIFKHTFNTLKGWDIRNGITYQQQGDSVILSKGEGLFFKRIPVDPGRKYELKLTGSGNGIVHIGWAEIVFDNPFKQSNEFKTSFKVPNASNPRMMLRFIPHKNSEFKITTVELTPLPEPKDWVRHNRKEIENSKPEPKVVRGIAINNFDNKKAKIIKKTFAKTVIIGFKNKSDLKKLNTQIDIALQNDFLPIVSLNNSKNLFETWLEAKKSLGDRLEKIYAFVLSTPDVPRNDINNLVKKLRPEFPNSWFIFNTSIQNYPELNPIDDKKIIYSAYITKSAEMKKVAEFKNMLPAPFMAFGNADLAHAFEAYAVSWIIGTSSQNLIATLQKVARPMHKGGNTEEQMQSLVNSFNRIRKQGTLEFAYATDTHYHSSEKITANSCTPMHMREMAKVAKYLKLDFVANGGDMVQGAKPRQENVKDMREVIEAMATSDLPVFATIGNHDDGVFWCLHKYPKSDISLITTGEDWHNACVKDVALGRGAVGDKNFDKANYFYMDFPESKIRVITMAMSENPMTIGKNGRFVIDSCGLLGVSPRQLDWLAHQALNFSDKPDAKEWGVIFISHTELSKNMPNGKLTMGVIDAFINGKKFEGETKKVLFASKVSCDFSQQGKIPVLMNICGHMHDDHIAYSPLGYLQVRTLQDRAKREEPNHPDRIMNTPSESSWSLVSVDRKNNEVILLRYGAGIDMKAPLLKK
ncbi:MAG: metallophosphoesterase [Opitutales bacterium]|nr:metallophosphoesterase [Opitutales bacterium]